MRFHVYTIRNGRERLGNCGDHLSLMMINEVKTLRGAIARAKRLAKKHSKGGDIICIDQATDDRPYAFNPAAHFTYYEG